MNKRIKKLWLAALRSGKFRQGRNALRSNDAFCCLGVLCELHRKEKGGEWDVDREDYSYLGEETVLPFAVTQWAGLPDDDDDIGNPHISPRKDGATAITLNDKGHKSFKFIADRIEKYL